MDEALAANPMAPDEEMKVTLLWQNDDHTANLVQLRGSIRAHYHETHDEVVMIVRGRATFSTGDASFVALPGDVFTIPRKTVHSVVADGYVAGISLFTPKFDGKDRIFVEK